MKTAIKCPFHDEETPSLIIDGTKDRVVCFGCGLDVSVEEYIDKLNKQYWNDNCRENNEKPLP